MHTYPIHLEDKGKGILREEEGKPKGGPQEVAGGEFMAVVKQFVVRRGASRAWPRVGMMRPFAIDVPETIEGFDPIFEPAVLKAKRQKFWGQILEEAGLGSSKA